MKRFFCQHQACLMLLAFGIGWHLFRDSVLPYAIMTGLNLIGREAGMTFGYANSFDHAHVVPLNIPIEEWGRLLK